MDLLEAATLTEDEIKERLTFDDLVDELWAVKPRHLKALTDAARDKALGAEVERLRSLALQWSERLKGLVGATALREAAQELEDILK